VKTILTPLLLALLTACGSPQKEQAIYLDADSQAIANLQEEPGERLLKAYCYACHGPEARGDDRLAPPMFAIKMHYQDEGVDKEEFVQLIVDWAKEPSAEKSRMPGALKRFGVMPYQPFPEDSLKIIAAYIYDNEMVHPGGSHGRGKGKHGKGHQQEH
jgi:hypothetical protein